MAPGCKGASIACLLKLQCDKHVAGMLTVGAMLPHVTPMSSEARLLAAFCVIMAACVLCTGVLYAAFSLCGLLRKNPPRASSQSLALCVALCCESSA